MVTPGRLAALAVGFVLVSTLVFLAALPAPTNGTPPAAMLAFSRPKEAATGAGFTENLTVPAGESATTTVWINRSETTSYLVSLTVAYPAGVGVALTPSRVEGNETATVTFVIDGSVAPATYPA